MNEGEITPRQIPYLLHEFDPKGEVLVPLTDTWASSVYIYADGEVWWGSWNEEKAEWNPWHRLGISDPHPFNGPVEMGKPVDTPREHKYVEQDFRDE